MQKMMQVWKNEEDVAKLWKGDPSLWTNHDENKWLGWLEIPKDERVQVGHIHSLAQTIASAGIKDIVVLGMGGSSLCPAMLSETFGKIENSPTLHVLDSTDPNQIKTLTSKLNLKHAFFIVSSKSGSTLEPNIFKKYFYHLMQETLNKSDVGEHFIAITDSGSMLESISRAFYFKDIFYGRPAIGGRYSALSNFGMVPAGLMGLNVDTILDSADKMAQACSPQNDPDKNPGVILGIALGVAAKQGKDKITLVVSPEIVALGAWIEQLLAESSGKEGKGLVPIDREKLGDPSDYGDDRLFVYIRLNTTVDKDQDQKINDLENAGHPIIRCYVQDIHELGGVFFQWEFAIAVAASIINVNPFDQPDVEASKVRAHELTTEFEKTGKITEPASFYSNNLIALYTDESNLAELKENLKGDESLEHYLAAHLRRALPGDYVDISAFIEMSKEHEAILQVIRTQIRNKLTVATCLGFGPRFLHSTGQLYKGGPNTGVFIQITRSNDFDISIPGEKYSFATVIKAQALSDFEVLTQRNRRVLRIHIQGDFKEGLIKLHTIFVHALGEITHD
jgi:transaldolase/glucose-6-phosphate isomerase